MNKFAVGDKVVLNPDSRLNLELEDFNKIYTVTEANNSHISSVGWMIKIDDLPNSYPEFCFMLATLKESPLTPGGGGSDGSYHLKRAHVYAMLAVAKASER